MDTTRANICDIINFGIPHIAEQIFHVCETRDLIACLSVSKTWKVIAEKVLLEKWKGKTSKACYAGHTKIVKLLLDHGYGLEKDVDITASLFLACKQGHQGIVNSFLECFKATSCLGNQYLNGLNPNDEDDFDVNPFMLACIYGKKNIVELFLNHPGGKCIEWNAKTWDCATAFYFACENGHSDVVKLLLDHSESKNIDLNTRFIGENNALDIAVLSKKINVIKVIFEHPVARKRIGWNFVNSKGETAFHLACQSGEEAIVQMFIDHSQMLNIDLNARYMGHGNTGWMDACKYDKPNIVKLLIQYPELIDFSFYHNMRLSGPIRKVLTTYFCLVPNVP